MYSRLQFASGQGGSGVLPDYGCCLKSCLCKPLWPAWGEGEHRAATISWIVVGLLAAFACFAWLRRGGPRKRGHSSGQQQEASISEPTSISSVD